MFGKLGMLGLVAVATVAADAATITKQAVRQMWPWNDKVRIDYTLDCAAGEQYDVELKVTDPLGRDVTGLSACQSGDLEYVTAGDHAIVWTPKKENFTSGNVSPLLKFELSVRAPIGKRYMVFDLDPDGLKTYDAARPIAVSYLDEPPAGGFNVVDYKTKKIAFRRCRAGTYLMGSPETEPGRVVQLKETLHKVTLTHDFYLAIFPTTCAQSRYIWDLGGEFTKQNFYCTLAKVRTFRGAATGNWAAGYTVDRSSFVGLLRQRVSTGLPAGYAIDLPTEAQWEYACRAGTQTAWNNGTDANYQAYVVETKYLQYHPTAVIGTETSSRWDANLDLLGHYMCRAGVWQQANPASNRSPGSFLPNAWGFYDMHGSTSDLCLDALDWNKTDNLGTADQVDPFNTASTGYYVTRGGVWCSDAAFSRSAARTYVSLDANPNNGISARLAVVYAPDAALSGE